MISSAQQLNTAAPLLLGRLPPRGLLNREIKIRELELGLARGADGGEDEVAAARGPADRVVEAHVGLDGYARRGVAQVRVVA
ncbi:hypothetical protein C0993_006795 [Termitomyces sp. T159_Od127]|nr:hypothetical protein C0993_006795 [Termitomyces sp. T159_Od127]